MSIYQAIGDPTWVLAVGLLTVAYYLYTTWKFAFWANKGVPFDKSYSRLGIFGRLLSKRVSLDRVMVNWYNNFKGERFGGVWELYTPKLFVLDPNLVRDILVKDFTTWSDRGAVLNPDVDPLSEHVAFLDGPKWKAVRTKLTPTFTSAKLKHMHYLLVECAKDLEKHMDAVATKGEPVEATDMSAKFTTDVIGSCAFGIEMNSLNDEDAIFRRMGKKMTGMTRKKMMILSVQRYFPSLFKLLKLSTMPQELTDFFLKIVSETFEHRDKNNVQRHDFIDLLRNLRSNGEPLGEGEVEFTNNLLAAQAFVFFGAGFSTSSMTISYCLHELAVNQDIQERLRQEVHKTKASNNGEITWDGLKNMKYLDMVLQETLRKYPIAPFVDRLSVRPYRIPDTDVVLPAGIRAIVPIYAIHHDPQYYPNPKKFDPERFTEEAKSQRPAFTYLPFGGGPRICIGSRFAEQETKMALVTMVDNFKISLAKRTLNPVQFKADNGILRPEGGIWLDITRIAVN